MPTLWCIKNNSDRAELTPLANKLECAYIADGHHRIAAIRKLYQVKSSTDPSKSYMVEKDSCECLGFKNFYKFHHGKGLKANCSHIEAVRIFKKE